MIGIVLAAGAGSRLGHHTAALPKTLLAVDAERSILDVAVGNLTRNGVRDIAVVAGYAAERIEDMSGRLQDRYDCRLTIVLNEKHDTLNNAYSLWTAREWLTRGALVVNGDTVHPASVEQTLLAADQDDSILLATDVTKTLGEEAMKVRTDATGQLTTISKLIDPATAHGEYIGVTLVPTGSADHLIDALRITWESEPHEYYERAFQRLADDGRPIRTTALAPDTIWVEVDDEADLVRAREIACHC